MKLIISFFLGIIPLVHTAPLLKNAAVIQVDISHLLNARPVTTFTHSKLVTWRGGIDGNGLADGYLTLSAALFNGDEAPHALPDNAEFEANASHPAIKLHYSNKDSMHNQACSMRDAGELEFPVKRARYRDLFLALTSAEGASALQITLTFIDATETKNFTLPDYYKDIADNDPDFCYLAHNLAKWDNKNKMSEKDHHNIDLLNIHPNPKRVLKSIKISKTKPGYLVFWAAAGVMTD